MRAHLCRLQGGGCPDPQVPRRLPGAHASVTVGSWAVEAPGFWVGEGWGPFLRSQAIMFAYLC